MERIKGKLIFDYDKESDVLDGYINKPRAAINIERGMVVLRLDPKSKKMVGFIIVNYKYKMDHLGLKKIPLFPEIELPVYK